MLLAYRQDPSFYAVGQALGMHHQKVRRYIERAKADGAMAALKASPPRQGADDHGRGQDVGGGAGLPEAEGPGLSARGLDDAASGRARSRAWTEAGACVPERVGPGHRVQDPRRARVSRWVRYLERRDPEFKAKMAQVLCVYREVSVLKKAAAATTKKNKPSKAVTVIYSYGEKPGHSSICNDRSGPAARAWRPPDLHARV